MGNYLLEACGWFQFGALPDYWCKSSVLDMSGMMAPLSEDTAIELAVSQMFRNIHLQAEVKLDNDNPGAALCHLLAGNI